MARIDDLSQVGYSNEESYTEKEAVTIRHLISKNQALVDALDAELDELMLQRDKHFDYVQRGKAALSPLKKLPHEIIREVFLHASRSTIIEIPFPIGRKDDNNKDDNNNDQNSDSEESDWPHTLMPTQVVLAQVCSVWRRIAFSTPCLWSVIWIQNMDDHALTIASELLSRAGGSAITLNGPLYAPFSSEAFDILIMSNQFKYLQTKLWYEQLLQFCQLPSPACVNLGSLLLDIHHGATQLEINITLNPDKYPRLKHLFIRLLGPRDGFIILQTSVIPWDQLTTLDLFTVHSSQLNALRQCKSLTSFKIGVEWDGINNVEEIYLPCLLKFTLRTFFEDVPSLLHIFNFPNLEEFETYKLTGPFSDDVQELLLQHFNFRRIRVLDIEVLMGGIDISALLSCTPCLESLCLQESIDMDQNTMNEVAVGTLGPSLRCIDLFGCEKTWDQALEFAETRWESATASQESGSSLKIMPFEKIKFNIIPGSQKPDHSQRREALESHGTIFDLGIPFFIGVTVM
jgi:hypothetical protein